MVRSFATLLLIVGAASAAGAASNFPAPAADVRAAQGKKTAVFAGGCFWCTEAVFEQVAGVEKVVSGYAGGDAASANYKKVSEGLTEHAESIEITYDPAKVSYGTLLRIFFSVAHDPTQLNRQGPDWGKQYRSAIFTSDPEERKVAAAYIAQLDAAKVFPKPIVTVIAPLEKFYPAESYHQDFVRNNPNHGYVVVNALPKVEKLRKLFPELVRK